jgi:hypothetical protein
MSEGISGGDAIAYLTYLTSFPDWSANAVTILEPGQPQPDRSGPLKIVTIITLVLMCIIVPARIVVRARAPGAWGADDWLILPAFVSLLPFAIGICFQELANQN